MSLRRFVFLTGLVLALAATSPSAALAAANGTDRPLTGTNTGTGTLNLDTGAQTVNFSGQLSHLGADSGHADLTITFTSDSTFTYTGTRPFVAANGDEVFSAVMGSGTSAPPTGESTETDTITGGTGRFAGATGTYTNTVSSVVVSVIGPIVTTRVTAVVQGQISY